MNKTLISILAGLGGMFGWGTSDFFANSASEKVGHTKTFFWSQIAGLGLIALIVLFFPPSFALSPLLLGLTLLSGITYALGYLMFYKGFEIGNVSVVSAVINTQVLFVILISYFLRGQTLTTLQIPAIVLILIGVTLVSTDLNDLKKGTVSLLKGVKETLLAAIFFGVFYWPLNEYIAEQSDWLAVSFLTKLCAILAVLALSLFISKRTLAIKETSKKLITLLIAVGTLEAVGVLSTTVGQQYGDSIIVAPIASSLTVVTVTLAMIFSKERINRTQGIGIALVVIGIIMTSL